MLELSYAEQQVQQVEQLLETLETKVLAVPGGIRVAVDPETVLEMQVMNPKPSLYVVDQVKNKMMKTRYSNITMHRNNLYCRMVRS